jgi:hypothetical protein
MMIVPCKTVEELLKKVLAYPRRVVCNDNKTSVGFKADDGTRFYIAMVDFEESANGDDIPFRTSKFLEARKSKIGAVHYCESINYGKPDFEIKK